MPRLGNRKAPLKAEFKAALARAQMTKTMWARTQGVTVQHLNMVLDGQRESARLLAEARAFVARHLSVAA